MLALFGQLYAGRGPLVGGLHVRARRSRRIGRARERRAWTAQVARDCVVCRGQGTIQIPCSGCRGSSQGCDACSDRGWVLVTCAHCKGSGET